MTVEDLHWLAGLLEGEGFFGTITSWVNGKPYRYPRIGVTMSDEDVINRVGEMWKVKTLDYDHPLPNRKRLYRVTKHGVGAIEIMKALYPLLGQRRKMQIDKVLEEYKNKISTHESRSKSMKIAVVNKKRDKDGKFISAA